MTETVITVQGTFSAWYPAERATVHLSVDLQGPDRQSVLEAATASADEVRESIEALHDSQAGPITWWSSDRVNVWAERPWNQDGKVLPPVFHASVGFTAKFKEFGSLAEWIERVAEISGVTIRDTIWDLTESRKLSVTAEVRSRAVKDAVSKATVFAQSIGLGTVRAIALSDPGMLGDQTGPGPVPVYDMMRTSKLESGGGPPLALKPEEIEVSAAVDARFIAT